MLINNYNNVLNEVNLACDKAGRAKDEVTLIAVSKTKPASDIQTLYDYGVRDFGENKVQELTSKYEELPKDIRWHLIGHLQTNKVKYIIDTVDRIHSVDSIKLAKEINRLSQIREKTTDILIEVNIGREESKSGVDPDKLLDFCYELSELPNIRVSGLMSIPPKECSEKFFCKMQELFIDIKAKNIDNSNVWVLSMGMSSDFPVAIKYGSNVVRIGTALFGSRK